MGQAVRDISSHRTGELIYLLVHFYSFVVFIIMHLQTILTKHFKDFFIFLLKTERVVGSLKVGSGIFGEASNSKVALKILPSFRNT